MSLAEKADTAAVRFCLNSIFFFNSTHGKISLGPLKIKGFAHLKAVSVCTMPTSASLGDQNFLLRKQCDLKESCPHPKHTKPDPPK